MSSVSRTIGHGVVWVGSSTVITKVLALASTFVVLTSLSLHEYGLTELILSLLGTLSIFLLPGTATMVIADMGTALARNARTEARRIFHDYAVISMALAALAAVFVVFGAALLERFANSMTPDLIALLAPLFLLTPLSSGMTVLFSAFKRFSSQAVFSILQEAGKLVSVIIFLKMFALGPAGVIYAIIASQLAAILLISPVAFALYRTLATSERAILRPWSVVVGHGFWNLMGNYLNSASQSLRLWIIKLMLGTEAVGIFAIAHGLIGHLCSTIPVNRVVALILPEYVDRRDQMTRLMAKGIKYQLIGYAFAALGAAAAVPVLLTYLFPEYLPALPYFYLMMLFLIPNSFGTLSYLFQVMKAQRNLFWSIAAKAASIVILAPLLIWTFGMWGVVIEYVLTSFLFLFERYRAVRRLVPGFRLTVRDVIVFDDLDRLVLDRFLAKFKRIIPRAMMRRNAIDPGTP